MIYIILYLDKYGICLVSTTTFVLIFYWIIILKYNFLPMKILTTLLYSMFITSYIVVFLKSPGIAGREYYKDTFKFEKEEDKINYQKCSKCNIIIPKSFRVVHCKKCGICVIRQDHHCPWTGKCIGKNNLRPFILFGCSLFAYIISLFVSFITCIVYVTSEKKK